MTEDQFWQLIDKARATADGDLEQLHSALDEKAKALSDEEVLSLHQHIWAFLAQSYQSKLWAAAYLINGGCSDDGFDYFRGWLIAQGREVFFAALENPDSLANVLVQIPDWQPWDELEFEAMLGIASSVYKTRTGEYPDLATPFPSIEIDWDEEGDAYFAENFPKLSALMETGEEDDESEDDDE
jgi:hypothetical protein